MWLLRGLLKFCMRWDRWKSLQGSRDVSGNRRNKSGPGSRARSSFIALCLVNSVEQLSWTCARTRLGQNVNSSTWFSCLFIGIQVLPSPEDYGGKYKDKPMIYHADVERVRRYLYSAAYWNHDWFKPVPRFPAPMRKGLENSKNSSGPFSPGWADVRTLRKLFVSCNLNRFILAWMSLYSYTSLKSFFYAHWAVIKFKA